MCLCVCVAEKATTARGVSFNRAAAFKEGACGPSKDKGGEEREEERERGRERRGSE